MFNTYQELVDRIDELLEERQKIRNKYDKRLNRMTNIYSLIPRKTIDKMYEDKKITSEERIYWEILQRKQRR